MFCLTSKILVFEIQQPNVFFQGQAAWSFTKLEMASTTDQVLHFQDQHCTITNRGLVFCLSIAVRMYQNESESTDVPPTANLLAIAHHTDINIVRREHGDTIFMH